MSHETVTEKTFKKWDYSEDFLYDLDSENKITNLRCKVCSRYVVEIRAQVKVRGITGSSLQSLISYVDGVNYVHKTNVARHVKSGSLHDWAKRTLHVVTAESNSTTGATTTRQSETTSDSTNPAQFGSVANIIEKNSKALYKHHFHTALTIAKKERPYSDLESLIDMQKKNEVKFVSGKTSDVCCREFIKCIATVLRGDISLILNAANFVCCEQDGSEARKTREEKELVFAKVVVRGTPVELFLKCQRMSDFGGVTANSTKAAIDDAFKTYHLDDEKYKHCLVAACADGASVNMGRLNGALTTLKNEDRPWMLIIHCSAHRIELAVKDAFAEVKDFECVEDMMLNLHIFFRNSGKCWRILLLVAERLGVLFLRFPKSSGTRFQVHKCRALKALIVNFLPLCLFAENMILAENSACKPDQKARLRGYYNQWLSYQYLACLQLYRQTLKVTAHLSYVCQENSSLITDVITTLQAAEDGLNAISNEDVNNCLPFPAVEGPNDSVTITVESTDLPATLRYRDKNQLSAKQREKADKHVTVVTKSSSLKRVAAGKAAVERIKARLIPAISNHIQERMSSFNGEIFSSFRIADHTQWDDTENFGISQIRQIAEHFKECLRFHNFSVEMALMEWKKLRKLVKAKFAHFSKAVCLWQKVFSHHHQQFPHILLIVELVLVMPYSSASVERGFSLMSRLLANSRLATSNASLDDLMVIKTNLPVWTALDVAYEDKLVEKAVNVYVESKRRRQSTKRRASIASEDLQSTTNSTDTFLPISADRVICTASHELTRDDEEFLQVHSDNSDQSEFCPDSGSDSDSD